MRKTSSHLIPILSFLMGFSLIFPLNAPAQEESQSFNQDVATSSTTPEEEGAEVTPISEDTTPIGIVDEINIFGEVVTSRGAVLRQMTFKTGDEISMRDLDLSRRRLLGLNNIYWEVTLSVDNTENEGHIIVKVHLRARRTWFISPTQAGGFIGDRNFLGSADTVNIGAFINGDDYYYSVGWQDPQFLGGHNSMFVEGHILDTNHTIRTDTVFSTGESYLIDRTGFSMNYSTRWNGIYNVTIGYKFDEVETDKFSDPFRSFGTDDEFFWSGQRIPDANIGVLSVGVTGGNLNSFFFPTKGYYWSLQNEVAGGFTGSDFDFSRHSVTYAQFVDLFRDRNVLAGRVMYSYLNGDPPNYELLPFDWQVRGYTGATHRGKSLLAMNFEYRFIIEPDIFQGVLFTDLGRSWDGHDFGFDDLEWGYGAGLRIYAGYFIPYNLLFRIDYGIGDDGSELTFGFNHFF